MRKKVQKKNSKGDRQSSRARRLGVSLTVIFCTALLAGGFFFAAQQHFLTMDYGMKNSRLRRQIDQLEAEKRRLIHAREVSLSAPEIKKAAKRVGLLDKPTDTTLEYARSADPADVRAAAVHSSAAKPLVTKTAATSAVPAAVKTVSEPRSTLKPDARSRNVKNGPEPLAISRPRLASTARSIVDK